MVTAAIILGVIGCVFGLLGMIAAGVTAVIVIGWKNSTHKIEYAPVPDTTVELDLPKPIQDQIAEDPKTLEQYIRKMRAQATLDDLYEES